MGTRLALLVFVLSWAGPAAPQPTGQTEPPIAVGEIDRIDYTSMSFVLKPPPLNDESPQIGGIGIGIGGAGTCVLSNPIPIPGGPGVGDNDQGSRCFTVRATAAAVVGESGRYLSFDTLRRGDHVSVRGRAYQNVIDATEITLLRNN